jgi:Bacterial Ig domain
VVFVASTVPETPATEVLKRGGPQGGLDDIYGQLIDANGNPVGAAFRISPTSQDSDEFNPPTVVYNPDLNEFLVVWDQGEEVFAQRVSAGGAVIGPVAPQISQAGVPPSEDIETQDIAWSHDGGRYLVIWKGNPDSTGHIFGQFVNADGTPAGATDFDFVGSSDVRVDDAIGLAYNATDKQFMMVARAKSAANEYEIYGQRVDLSGAQIGADDVRISHMGPDGDASYVVQPPDVVWNSRRDQFLVSWTGADNTPPLVKGEVEVFGQLLGADGSFIGSRIRISDMGPDGDTNYAAFRARLIYNPNADQYLATWHGDDNTPPQVDNELETWGQVLAADGTQVGTNDFRVSHDGTDGSVDSAANRPSVDYNSATCDYATVWNTGKIGDFGGVSEEREVFGSRISAPPCPPPPPPPAAKDSKAPSGSVAGVRRACVAKSLRVRISSTDASGVASVRVTLDGKRVKSTSKARFTLRINAKKLKSGRHRLSILITDKAGNQRRITRRFSVCAATKPRRKSAPRFTG